MQYLVVKSAVLIFAMMSSEKQQDEFEMKQNEKEKQITGGKTMKLNYRKYVKVYPSGAFECKICGQTWHPDIQPLSGGRLKRGSWQCPNGCTLQEDEQD